MQQPKSQKDEEETLRKKEAKKPSVKFPMPSKASMEDIMRALGILADKGGEARFKDMSGMFGPKTSHNVLLSNSLGAGVAFGLIKPHKGKAPYILSSFGKKFLTVPEEQSKAMLLPKFLGLKGYKDILVQIKNHPDKSLKKEVITKAWLNVISGSKRVTRELYTKTFANVGKWCGAITDTGQTCSLTPKGEPVLNQILKGEEAKGVKPTVPTAGTPPRAPAIPTKLSFQVSQCPHCGKTEFAIENEELLNTVSADGTNVLIIKYTFYCRGCRGTFSLIGQQTIKVD